MRRASRIDENQPEIVDALRVAGAEVTSLAAVGHGVPDLLVSFVGRWFLIEVKDGNKPPSRRQLTDDQKKWHRRQHATIHTVCTVDEAMEAIGLKGV